MRTCLRRLALLLVAGWLPFCPISAAPSLPAADQGRAVPDVGFEPTMPAVAETMLRLADVRPEDVVYDLGSGDGRIVILAAERE